MEASVKISKTTLMEAWKRGTDEFWRDLRKNYPEFDEWVQAHGDREAHICYNKHGNLTSIMVPKFEPADDWDGKMTPSLPSMDKLKVCLFKCWCFNTATKMLAIARRIAEEKKCRYIYMTVPDGIRNLTLYLLKYGFKCYGLKGKEAVFVLKIDFSTESKDWVDPRYEQWPVVYHEGAKNGRRNPG
jgi:hypothetical protein